MKTAIGILTVIVVALGWQLATEKTMNNQLRGQLVELTSKRNDKSARENLELQEKCAKQAEASFLQNGYKYGTLDSWQSHYNTKLNKCFVTVNSMQGEIVAKNLVDAYEQRVYASYMWKADKVKKYWEVPPFECELTPPSSDVTHCKTQDEYDAFVASYME